MDTIKLCYNIKLDIKKLNKSHIKWTLYKNSHGLYYYSCIYNGVKFVYYQYYNTLTIELSITKFLYGCNWQVLNINDLKKLCSELDSCIRITTKHSIPSVYYWNITRLDLVKNFIVKEKDIELYMEIFKKIKYRYCVKKNTTFYSKGIHVHNLSTTYNFYQKHHVDMSAPLELIRLEIQLKRRHINYLNSSGKIPSKEFGSIINNIEKLEEIYFEKLENLGLTIDFYTERMLTKHIEGLYKKNIISRTIYTNMISAFITHDKHFSKNTLTTYKNILAKDNISYITTKEKIRSKLNFNNLYLFKRAKEIIINLLMLIFIYMINFLTVATFNNLFILSINKIFCILPLLIFYIPFLDDG